MSPKTLNKTTLGEVLAAYGAAASTTTRSPPTTEESPIKEFLVLDKKGRLLIDVAGADHGAPHRKQTYRHRVSFETMEQASPVWKETIFGPEGQRQMPTDEEEWIIQLPDDEPLSIRILLALIHDRPDVVPDWHGDTDTVGACTQIAKAVATADKYGVLPLLRPFVSDWLAPARPRPIIHTEGNGRAHEGLDPNAVHRLEVAWQLGAAGLVEEHVRNIVFASGLTSAVLNELLTEANDAAGILTSVSELLGVVAKRRRQVIQSALNFFQWFLANLRSEEGKCKMTMPIFPGLVRSGLVFQELDRQLCDMAIDVYITKRMMEESQLVGEIPEEAQDYHSSIHRLLHTIGYIFGMGCDREPTLPPNHTCFQILRKKFKDFEQELLGRWRGSESVLESEQLEWLKRRSDTLAADGRSS